MYLVGTTCNSLVAILHGGSNENNQNIEIFKYKIRAEYIYSELTETKAGVALSFFQK